MPGTAPNALGRLHTAQLVLFQLLVVPHLLQLHDVPAS
jgi:hypothetical protein